MKTKENRVKTKGRQRKAKGKGKVESKEVGRKKKDVDE
jgi:hypothetical protein